MPASQWTVITILAAALFVASVFRLSRRDAPPAPPAPAPVIVSVQGEVVQPGVYALPPDSATVETAIRAAGGVRGDGDARSLELMGRRLRPGGQLCVVRQAHGGIQLTLERMDARSLLALGHKLDVNTATEEELALIPAMKKDVAAAIVSRRQQIPWNSLDDLKGIPGVGGKTVEKWRDYLEIKGED